jgi:hypothetical protein
MYVVVKFRFNSFEKTKKKLPENVEIVKFFSSFTFYFKTFIPVDVDSTLMWFSNEVNFLCGICGWVVVLFEYGFHTHYKPSAMLSQVVYPGSKKKKKKVTKKIYCSNILPIKSE